MDKNFSKDFLVCPACGSTDRFFETLAKEIKDRGIARPEWNFAYDTKTGKVTDPAREQAIPIGSELPAYHFSADICMECGCVYATKLRRIQAHRSVDQPKKPPLNMPPGLMRRPSNNPRLS